MKKHQLKKIIKECILEELDKNSLRNALRNQSVRSKKTKDIQPILDSLFLESPKLKSRIENTPNPVQTAQKLQTSKTFRDQVIDIVNKHKNGNLTVNDISNFAETLGYSPDTFDSFVSSQKHFFNNLSYN